jgi:hypothetical protein
MRRPTAQLRNADACIWLTDNGVEPDEIVWIRPREPWMLDRAVVQPDPAVATTLAADVLEATAGACSVGEMFLRLEDKGVTLRIDRAALTTMARTPTHGRWELDRLRAIENVVRLGRLRRVCRGRLVLESGDVEVADDAVVVHAAAPGLPVRPTVPVWDDGAFSSDPGIEDWADGLALNPARMSPEDLERADVAEALERVQRVREPGMARTAEFACAS